MTPAIEFSNVSRVYGDVRAVDQVSLQIASGEFFAMLGPSGSGKTTCLRLIAGFDLPDGGQILLDGDDVTDRPPYARDVNTVFQDYALFPHMNVLENVAYGLRVRKVSGNEQRRRTMEMLELVKLSALAQRRPSQLSGGQRQRVSLARALINRPRVLLLDEPLGALDLKLREEMQIELKNLQRQLGITFVFVTHDQGEALSMADRVAVFNQGKVEQLDTPRILYTRPATAFVARFVGSANVAGRELAQALTGSAQPFAIRAEKIRVQSAGSAPQPGTIHCNGTLIDVQYHGAISRYQVQLASGDLFAAAVSNHAETQHSAIGSQVTLHWSASDAVPLAGEPG
ncbi:ABC transporter ATP-binding protein [Povalibacter sp.]|uniref:ABC transporter ATP-binding protein n=1 Tax=Povalibacter sp. TaxID=1962978 RepID=UPI002F3F5E40